jgi:hypothetical protein
MRIVSAVPPAWLAVAGVDALRSSDAETIAAMVTLIFVLVAFGVEPPRVLAQRRQDRTGP